MAQPRSGAKGKKPSKKRFNVKEALQEQSETLQRIDSQLDSVFEAVTSGGSFRQIFPGYIVLIDLARLAEVGRALALNVNGKTIEHWFLYTRDGVSNGVPYAKYTYPGSAEVVSLLFRKMPGLNLDLDKPADLKKFVDEELLTKYCDYQRAESVKKTMPAP